ncbi:hypothetical protein BD309DRAFT_954065 [Dichomitus squalens]|uniref:Uncharacterized protein n=1 Tax=Dichomitus squalens TaxID=114155 RepID=A0A4Q9NX59_9APHY|nr:uncharacterized protein DICSQDRAFT_177639 [Dichomitus squalens LYAD-421 SS1]EJF66295.1 hypothetical protein DICSQDRAFT_177639 [Dichomitus squalens LYAD-421 SS1]TBU46440.1 hypothetical protein BD309DRAFT_954065 [Dichomitus squalens]TBU65295.1 hypothetical protein BD310DRAFT_911093 [Dichomitus squalens]
MSDISDDDLADNYGPTTPAPVHTKAAAASRARAGGASGKPVAGPSTKPQPKAAVSKKGVSKPTNAIELDDDDSEGVVFVEEAQTKKQRKSSEAEVVAMPGPTKGASKKAPVRGASAVNGTSKAAAAAAKGKARADPSPADGDAMEVEEDTAAQVDEEGSAEQPPPRSGVRGGSKQPLLRGKNTMTAAAASRLAKENQRLLRDMDRLRAELEQMRTNNKEREKLQERLEASFDEMIQRRTTDAEEIKNDVEARHKEEIQRKDSLIQELTGQLSKQSPSSSSQSWTLHFLTREAAEEEKRALRDENTRLKDVIKQHNAVIGAKDQQIADLKQEVDLTKKELQAEIERSNQLASRSATIPASVVPNGTKAVRGPANNLPVIKLYEDMTNVLVTSVQKEPSVDWPGIDEDVISCIYTYENKDENITFSLNFMLRNQFDRPENYSGKEALPKDKLVEKVKYIPRNLELERPDYVERLQFFKEPFMFARDQMTVFLKTLTDTVSGIFESEDGGDEPGGADEPIVVD